MECKAACSALGGLKMKSMGISYAAHRYAPELFTALKVYGRPFALEPDKLRDLGNVFSTKGHAACIAAIKRLYRAAIKKRGRCTIGFMLKDSKSEYCYTRSLSAYDDDIRTKLRIYKEFKRDMIDRGCRYEVGESASLGAGYKVERVVKMHREVDVSRPVKIHYV